MVCPVLRLVPDLGIERGIGFGGGHMSVADVSIESRLLLAVFDALHLKNTCCGVLFCYRISKIHFFACVRTRRQSVFRRTPSGIDSSRTKTNCELTIQLARRPRRDRLYSPVKVQIRSPRRLSFICGCYE